MRMLEHRRTWFNLGVEGRRQAPDLDSDKVLRDKRHFVHRRGRGSHCDGEDGPVSLLIDGAPLKTTLI
jgi:hypothetical protein